MYSLETNGQTFVFADLKILMAKATPIRSGDQLAGIAASSLTEMVAAQSILATLPLSTFISEYLIPPEQDEITRLILRQHNKDKFKAIAHLSVGELRDYLLSYECDTAVLTDLQYALTPEMVAAVSKIMRNQDLIAVAKKCRVVTQFRNTIGLEGRFSTRLQPNDPCDDLNGIASGLVDGLLYGCGDAVLGINPASDSLDKISKILTVLDQVRTKLNAPLQTCVLTHISNSIMLAKKGVPVDLFFQSIGGTEASNKSFGINLALLKEAHDLGLSLKRGTIGTNCMYFETGQGNALSANSHHGVDQQTIEARSYAVAREFSPLLVNSVVGFIGPEYLLDGKQITRAALEDHFCGKLLGLPMGCDVCYTNHSFADQNEMDNLLLLLAEAGCNFVMSVPGADDVMLNYQSTSSQDIMYIRKVTGLRPSPEFEDWLMKMKILRQNKLVPFEKNITFDKLLPESLETHAISKVKNEDRSFDLSKYTHARVGMGHTGGQLKSQDWLRFQFGFAAAKDAVFSEFSIVDTKQLCHELTLPFLVVDSQIRDPKEFLMRPDLGRLLSLNSQIVLNDWMKTHDNKEYDLLIVVSGGLSPVAIQHQIPSFLPLLVEQANAKSWQLAPIIINPRGRVALGDQINAFIKAKMVVVLIGERPGLTSPDSMGIYFTYQATPGCTDERRNCISNIHQQGMSCQEAVARLVYLLDKSFEMKMTGVNLKDDFVPTKALTY